MGKEGKRQPEGSGRRDRCYSVGWSLESRRVVHLRVAARTFGAGAMGEGENEEKSNERIMRTSRGKGENHHVATKGGGMGKVKNTGRGGLRQERFVRDVKGEGSGRKLKRGLRGL